MAQPRRSQIAVVLADVVHVGEKGHLFVILEPDGKAVDKLGPARAGGQIQNLAQWLDNHLQIARV